MIKLSAGGWERTGRLAGTLPGVAAWDPDAETMHPVDFRLVHNTFVTMYWRSSLLDETIDWLRSHRYDVVQFDAASWASAAEMLDDVAAGLDFPPRSCWTFSLTRPGAPSSSGTASSAWCNRTTLN